MDDNDWIRSVNNKGIYTGGQLKGGLFAPMGEHPLGNIYNLMERLMKVGDVARMVWLGGLMMVRFYFVRTEYGKARGKVTVPISNWGITSVIFQEVIREVQRCG